MISTMRSDINLVYYHLAECAWVIRIYSKDREKNKKREKVHCFAWSYESKNEK